MLGANEPVTDQASTEPIQFARLPDGIVVIRVTGRGSHLETPSLRVVFNITKERVPPPSYIFDLTDCTTMDSTFMGTLASIGIFQCRRKKTRAIATNLQDHVRELLEMLGLKYILELREGNVDAARRAPQGSFTPAERPDIDRPQRILMMIEAHQHLIDLDRNNEVKFEGVLKTLRKSLESG